MITKPTRFYRDGRIFVTSTHSLGSWVMVARSSRPATPARPSSGSVLGEKTVPMTISAVLSGIGGCVRIMPPGVMRSDEAMRRVETASRLPWGGGVLRPGRPRSCGRASGTVGFRRAQASVRHGGHRRARASVRGAGATGLAQACSWNVCILRKPLAHAAIMELWKAHRR